MSGVSNAGLVSTNEKDDFDTSLRSWLIVEAGLDPLDPRESWARSRQVRVLGRWRGDQELGRPRSKQIPARQGAADAIGSS
jgi:hypothetical protein